jgi:hypothetical protein
LTRDSQLQQYTAPQIMTLKPTGVRDLTMAKDFRVTREVMGMLDEWILALAGPLGPPIPVPIKAGTLEEGFWWQFREQSERALLVAKAVRCVSGFRAAMLLADRGFIEECGAILRTVSDFTYEILSICDGLQAGKLSEEQAKFIRQYFAEMTQTPEQYTNEKRERWVTRDELLKAHYKRFAESANADPEHVRRIIRFLSYSYDKFVHGAYITAMELYDGATGRFMLNGHTYPDKLEEYRFAVAAKFHEFLGSLVMMASALNIPALAAVIAQNDRRLTDAGELLLS